MHSLCLGPLCCGPAAFYSLVLMCFSVEDIHYLVLQNLMQSTLSLSNSQSNSCQSFQVGAGLNTAGPLGL